MNQPAAAGAPQSLEFRLRNFIEHESTDRVLEGASDETWLSAIGLDSSSFALAPDGSATLAELRSPLVGELKQRRAEWKPNPYVLLRFDLTKPGSWPRTYTTTLFLVDKDNENLAESFRRIEEEVGKSARTAVVNAARAGGVAAGSALAGPVGAAALGFLAGEIAGPVYDAIISEIYEGLRNEVFRPIPLTLTLNSLALASGQPGVNSEQVLRIREHGADYSLAYDWHLVTSPQTAPAPPGEEEGETPGETGPGRRAGPGRDRDTTRRERPRGRDEGRHSGRRGPRRHR